MSAPCLEQLSSWAWRRQNSFVEWFAQPSLPYFPMLGNGWVVWEGGSQSSDSIIASIEYCCFTSTATVARPSCLWSALPYSKIRQEGKAVAWEHVAVVFNQYCLWKPPAVRVFVFCGTFFFFFCHILSVIFHLWLQAILNKVLKCNYCLFRLSMTI